MWALGPTRNQSIPEQEAEDTYLNRKREESEEKEPGGRGIDAEKQSLVEHAILAAARLLLLPSSLSISMVSGRRRLPSSSFFPFRSMTSASLSCSASLWAWADHGPSGRELLGVWVEVARRAARRHQQR